MSAKRGCSRWIVQRTDEIAGDRLPRHPWPAERRPCRPEGSARASARGKRPARAQGAKVRLLASKKMASTCALFGRASIRPARHLYDAQDHGSGIRLHAPCHWSGFPSRIGRCRTEPCNFHICILHNYCCVAMWHTTYHIAVHKREMARANRASPGDNHEHYQELRRRVWTSTRLPAGAPCSRASARHCGSTRAR